MRITTPINFSDGALTRSTTATYFGSDGLLKSAAVNVERFTYDPSDLSKPPYLLLETAAATNVLLYGRDGTNVAWSKTDTTPTLNQVGIDGAANSATLYTQGSAGTALVTQAQTVAAGSTISFDAFLKRGNNDWLCFTLSGPSQTNGMRVWVNLATGATSGMTTIGAGSGCAATAILLASGFVWLQLNCKPDASYTSANVQFWAVTGAGVTTRASGATYVIDYSKIEVGSSASFPILTTSAAVTRAADVVAAAPCFLSSIPEPASGETAWASGTTYAVGDKRTYLHRIYQRAVAGAGTTAPNLDMTNWTDIGPVNRYAAIDLLRNSVSSASGSISYAFTPGVRVSTLALVGLQASYVRVTMRTGSTVYYSKVFQTYVRLTKSWSSYFFGKFSYLPTLAIYDLPYVAGATITVTALGTTPAIGGIVVGNYVDAGITEGDAVSDCLNFSNITRDTFGNLTLVPRASVPTSSVRIYAPKSKMNDLRALRASLNAVPALYSGLDANSTHDYFDAFLVVGIYKKFRITARQTELAVELDLEEMT